MFKEWRRKKTRQAEEKYKTAKKIIRNLVHEAQEVERRKLVDKLEEGDGKGSVFRVVKKMVQANRDVVGDGCIKDEGGKVVVDQDECREVWKIL